MAEAGSVLLFTEALMMMMMMMMMLLLAFDAPAAAAFQWDPTPEDGAEVVSCTDHTVSFRWGYSLEQGDVVSNVEWTFHGAHSQEMVAISAHNNFFATPTFSHRVRFVPDAGLALSHVTLSDGGNYSVTVTGTDKDGAAFTSSRMVALRVIDQGSADTPLATDGQLKASQRPGSVYSNNTGQWHSVLQCGHFTFTTQHPPLTIVWETPEGGSVNNSTGYSQGYFTLLLPNPVSDGRYTCRIASSSRNLTCLGDLNLTASVEVNAVLTRLLLLEAQQQRLVQDNALKAAEISALKARLDNEVDLVREDLSSVSTELHNLNSCPALQSYCYDYDNVTDSGPCSPGQHKVVDDPSRLTSNGRGTSCDDTVHGWYRFLANGKNAVIPTSCVIDDSCNTDGPMWLDLQGHRLPLPNQELETRACGTWYTTCCFLHTPIKVRNCGNFYIYLLYPPVGCNQAYCNELQ